MTTTTGLHLSQTTWKLINTKNSHCIPNIPAKMAKPEFLMWHILQQNESPTSQGVSHTQSLPT